MVMSGTMGHAGCEPSADQWVSGPRADRWTTRRGSGRRPCQWHSWLRVACGDGKWDEEAARCCITGLDWDWGATQAPPPPGPGPHTLDGHSRPRASRLATSNRGHGRRMATWPALRWYCDPRDPAQNPSGPTCLHPHPTHRVHHWIGGLGLLEM